MTTSPTGQLIDFGLNRTDLLELLAEIDVAGGEITFTSRPTASAASRWTVHVVTDVGANGIATCSGQGDATALPEAYAEAVATLRLDQTVAGIR